jgi:hypothetical protein
VQIDQQLAEHAERILSDGFEHSRDAITWARQLLQRMTRSDTAYLLRIGFTIEEISLGSGL